MSIESSLAATREKVPFVDRYAGAVRYIGAVIVGIISGFLLLSSMQVGAALSLTGAGAPEWTWVEWDNHWAWRAVCSLAATAAAAFLAGLAARSRGSLVAAIASVPTVLFWILVSVIGALERFPGTADPMFIPLGYRIIAAILVVATIPLATRLGREGAAFGRANARHFDSRRGTLFGIRWYHYLWLPFLLHFMVLTAAFGSMYGFQWVLISWKAGYSVFSFLPLLFVFAMFGTLQLLSTGAMSSYEALAGFDTGRDMSVPRQVLKYGFGYTIATIAAQAGVALLHFGLATVMGKFGA